MKERLSTPERGYGISVLLKKMVPGARLGWMRMSRNCCVNLFQYFAMLAPPSGAGWLSPEPVLPGRVKRKSGTPPEATIFLLMLRASCEFTQISVGLRRLLSQNHCRAVSISTMPLAWSAVRVLPSSEAKYPAFDLRAWVMKPSNTRVLAELSLAEPAALAACVPALGALRVTLLTVVMAFRSAVAALVPTNQAYPAAPFTAGTLACIVCWPEEVVAADDAGLMALTPAPYCVVVPSMLTRVTWPNGTPLVTVEFAKARGVNAATNTSKLPVGKVPPLVTCAVGAAGVPSPIEALPFKRMFSSPIMTARSRD